MSLLYIWKEKLNQTVSSQQVEIKVMFRNEVTPAVCVCVCISVCVCVCVCVCV